MTPFSKLTLFHVQQQTTRAQVFEVNTSKSRSSNGRTSKIKNGNQKTKYLPTIMKPIKAMKIIVSFLPKLYAVGYNNKMRITNFFHFDYTSENNKSAD